MTSFNNKEIRLLKDQFALRSQPWTSGARRELPLVLAVPPPPPLLESSAPNFSMPAIPISVSPPGNIPGTLRGAWQRQLAADAVGGAALQLTDHLPGHEDTAHSTGGTQLPLRLQPLRGETRLWQGVSVAVVGGHLHRFGLLREGL